MSKILLNKKIGNRKKGFSLGELVVSIAIFAMIIFLVSSFQRNIFFFNSYIQSDLTAQMEGRRAIQSMVSEIREMSSSSLGAYPIAAAATSSVTFFSDVDADTAKEQVRYYVQGEKILKSVVNPTGNPLAYNQGSAIITTVVNDIGNGSGDPLFQYFDTNYAGTTTPLSVPVDVSLIKLVKINIILDRRTSQQTEPIVITSQVTPRNLKDNL